MSEELFHPCEGDPLDDPRGPNVSSIRQRRRDAKLFAQLPIDAFQALAAQAACPLLAVILELDRLVMTSFGRTNKVRLSNVRLRTLGVTRPAKVRALSTLEAAGLVAIKKAVRRSPTVTVLWRGGSGARNL
jgi:hypothetical protein